MAIGDASDTASRCEVTVSQEARKPARKRPHKSRLVESSTALHFTPLHFTSHYIGIGTGA